MTPHNPGQGSWHFLLIHAVFWEQSELTMHSGLQLGGEPIILGWQEHWHLSPMILGWLLLGPQGFGSQGSSTSTAAVAIKFN